MTPWLLNFRLPFQVFGGVIGPKPKRYKYLHQLTVHMDGGIVLTIPPRMPEPIFQLVVGATSFVPENRPAMGIIAANLRQFDEG